MTKEESLQLIQEFIDEKLDGDIQKFHEYDLSWLENDEKYGGRDPDDTIIANAIYKVLWEERIDEYENLADIVYRGDTINSFRTLMGDLSPDQQNFTGIIKHTNNPEIMDMAKMFYHKYHTIGNMIILPNKPIEIGNGKKTLNQFRGGEPFHDYFDLFLEQLKIWLTDPCYWFIDIEDKSTLYLKELISENFDFYAQYNGIDGFRKFIDDFYLDHYVSKESLYITGRFYHHLCYWKNDFTNEEYENAVIDYITQSTEFIDYRCTCMIEDLKMLLDGKTISEIESEKVRKRLNEIEIKIPLEDCVNESNVAEATEKKQIEDDAQLESEYVETEYSKPEVQQINIEQKEIVMNKKNKNNQKTKWKKEKGASILFKIPYVGLILIAMIELGLAFLVYADFVKAGGFGYLDENLGEIFLDGRNIDLSNGLFYGFCLVFSLMGIVYAIKHEGIKRIFMVVMLSIQAFLVLMQGIRYLIALLYSMASDNWVFEALMDGITYIGINELINIIFIPLLIITMLPLFIMFMLEKEYRNFVKCWALTILLDIAIFPLLLICLSHVVSAVILVLIIEAITIGLSIYWLYQAVTYRCDACGKFNALELVDEKSNKLRDISVQVETEIKDLQKNQWGTVDQYVPGKEVQNTKIYRCKYCGHQEKKVKFEKVANI